MIAPSRINRIAVEERMGKAMRGNKIELGEAKGMARKARVLVEQAKLFGYAPEELGLLEQKAQQAEAKYQREQRRVAAEQAQFTRLQAKIERLNLAP